MWTASRCERADVEHAEQVESENDDEHAADSADPVAVADQHLSQHRRGGAQRQKHDREAGDEQQRMRERHPPRAPDVVDAETGDEADVARDQWQHARREKAENSSREADGDAERGSLHPQDLPRALSIAAASDASPG